MNKEEIEKKVMEMINRLFPFNNEPVAITSAIEFSVDLTVQKVLKEVEKIIDSIVTQYPDDDAFNLIAEDFKKELKQKLKEKIKEKK